jgi:hypothetical protein
MEETVMAQSTPFTRENWNKIIRDVNAIITDPPSNTDCNGKSPLDEVGPDHLWSKGDIRLVQDVLKETCPDIEFEDIPDLWKQSIVDDIYKAMDQAWCDCEPRGCIPCTFQSGSKLLTIPARLDFECPKIYPWPDIPDAWYYDYSYACPAHYCQYMQYEGDLNGFQVLEPGFSGRYWQVARLNLFTGQRATSPFGGGTAGNIDKYGKIVCTGKHCMGGVEGYALEVYGFCSNCYHTNPDLSVTTYPGQWRVKL